MSSRRRKILLASQIIVSIFLIGLLVHLVDPRALIQATAAIPIWSFLLALALLGVFHAMSAVRLKLVLRAPELNITLLEAFELTWLSIFASNFLPSSVGGDAVVAVVLRRSAASFGQIVLGLAFNRLSGIVALALLLPTVLFIDGLASLRPVLLQGMWWLSIFLAVGALSGSVLFMLLRQKISVRFTLVSRVLMTLRVLWADAVRRRAALLMALLISLVMMLVASLGVGVLTWALMPGTTLAAIFGVVIVFSAIQLIPITFNGIGLQESATAFCFIGAGWPPQEAIALGFAIRLAAIVISLPGLAMLFKIGYSKLSADIK